MRKHNPQSEHTIGFPLYNILEMMKLYRLVRERGGVGMAIKKQDERWELFCILTLSWF